MPALVLAALSVLIWLYLLAARGLFWYLGPFDDDLAQHTPPSHWPKVVAIVPARNEAEHISESILSLLQQDYPGEFSVILVDDHSEDSTAAIAHRAAQSSNSSRRLSMQSASTVPSGWTGKLWALHNGVCSVATINQSPQPPPLSPQHDLSSRAARGVYFSSPPADAATMPTYFWFSDADIVHAADTLRRLVSRAEQQQLELASLMVLLHAKTLPESALIPAFLFFFLKLYPPRWIAARDSRTAGAAGGCVLLRRAALDGIGGLAAIRGEVIDDCSLARAIKRNGGRLWMGLTRTSSSLRAYATFNELCDLIARTAFTQLNYSALLLVGTLAGLFITYLAPIALLFVHHNITRVIALAGWLLMSLLFLPTVRFYRLSPLWAPLLPLTALFYSYATLLSAVRYYLRRGGQWKGRSQAPR